MILRQTTGNGKTFFLGKKTDSVLLRKPKTKIESETKETKIEPETKETKIERETQFRISAKKLFLTYSQVNPDITIDSVLKSLKKKFDNFEFSYVIAKERHKQKEGEEGGFFEDFHFHVLLLNNTTKFNIRSSDFLDIYYNGVKYHGHYKTVQNLKASVEYICKSGDYETNFPNLVDGRLLGKKEMVIHKIKTEGTNKALIKYSDENPKITISGQSTHSYRKYWREYLEMKSNLERDKIETPFKLENFKKPADLEEWMRNLIKSLILVGSSGIGKTQFCKAFLQDRNLTTLMVNNKEDLQRLDDSYDAILFDNFNMHEIKDTQLLAMLDNETAKTLRVLYSSVYKKAGIIVMVAMNKNEFCRLQTFFREERILRRIVLISPPVPFMTNININVTNNYNIISNKIMNNSNNFDEHRAKERIHINKQSKLLDSISR